MVFVNYGNVIEAAHREGKWVGVYSEMAGEPSATPLLHGLQLDGLSASPKLNKSSEDLALQRREVLAYLQSILKKAEPEP